MNIHIACLNSSRLEYQLALDLLTENNYKNTLHE